MVTEQDDESQSYVELTKQQLELEKLKLALLQRQQLFFGGKAAAKAGQLAIAADDTMAGNDDGNWILSVGGPDRTRGFRITHTLC